MVNDDLTSRYREALGRIAAADYYPEGMAQRALREKYVEMECGCSLMRGEAPAFCPAHGPRGVAQTALNLMERGGPRYSLDDGRTWHAWDNLATDANDSAPLPLEHLRGSAQ